MGIKMDDEGAGDEVRARRTGKSSTLLRIGNEAGGIPLAVFCYRSVYTPALRWDNLQETHGQSPPSHPALISADLCGSGFPRSH